MTRNQRAAAHSLGASRVGPSPVGGGDRGFAVDGFPSYAAGDLLSQRQQFVVARGGADPPGRARLRLSESLRRRQGLTFAGGRKLAMAQGYFDRDIYLCSTPQTTV